VRIRAHTEGVIRGKKTILTTSKIRGLCSKWIKIQNFEFYVN